MTMRNSGKKSIIYSIVVSAVFLFLVSSCSKDEATGVELVKKNGTITYNAIEGGGYDIHADDGIAYEALNMTSEFKIDGMKVYFEGEVQRDLGSSRQIGPIIKLMSISKL